MDVSLSRLGGTPPPLTPYGEGGLHLEPLDSEPPEKPIAPPGGNGSFPNQDPTCLCSTIANPESLKWEQQSASCPVLAEGTK